MEQKIRSKADAKRLVENIEDVASDDEYYQAMTGERRLLFGFTEHWGPYDWEKVTLYIYQDGRWESFYTASGGTRSQASSPVDNPVELIWRNRRAINASIQRTREEIERCKRGY